MESVKKWKHYLMEKEIVIHRHHQPLQCLQSKTKLQQSQHHRWTRFSQKFHLVIKYNKGTTNKVADMLSIPSLNTSIILQNSSLAHESYIEQYAIDTDSKDFYESLTHGAYVEEVNYHVHERLLYHLGKFFIP